MTDSARTVIDTALDAAGSAWGSFSRHVGGRKWSANAAAPAVFVRYGDIAHEAATETGGDNAALWNETQALLVRILGADEESARALKNALLRAFRNASTVADGVNPGSFRWLTEEQAGYSRDGAALLGVITIKLPVPKRARPQQYATVEAIAITAELNP